MKNELNEYTISNSPFFKLKKNLLSGLGIIHEILVTSSHEISNTNIQTSFNFVYFRFYILLPVENVLRTGIFL